MAVARTAVRAARDKRTDLNGRWRDASPSTRTRIQVGVFFAVIVVAYHYSLSTLIQTLGLDTPLAYIGLVPVIAIGLAALRSRPQTEEPAIYDRQVDYIVGVPLMVTALAINLLLPGRLSTMFWVWRIDLLSFPFFVAGVMTIIFGVRVLWRQRLAVSYLFLAWPLPYTVLLLRDLNAVTSVTLRALNALLHVVKFATLVPSTSGSIFNVTHNGRLFQLSVVSACTGVNGMVGFLLVGMAFAAIVTGPKLRKTVWLLGGLFLLWAINLGRLLVIFWAGEHFGEHFAIDVLHPFVGLVTFNIGIILMLLLLRPAGLRIGGAGARAIPRPHKGAVDAVAAPPRPLAVPAVYSAIALVVVMGLILGINNSGLRAYDLVAQASGEPKLSSYLLYPASPSGWGASFSAEYDFAKPFFGESSTWYRYTYSPTIGESDLHSSLPVIADVINTDNLSSFSAYGVEACYRFHGYKLRDISRVNLGGGVTGQSLSYTTSGRDAQAWSIVYWIWPVRNGTSTRYERIILYLLGNNAVQVSAPGDPGLTSPGGSSTGIDVSSQQLGSLKGFLVGFAREVIEAQTKVPAGARLSTSRGPSAPVVPRNNGFGGDGSTTASTIAPGGA